MSDFDEEWREKWILSIFKANQYLNSIGYPKIILSVDEFKMKPKRFSTEKYSDDEDKEK